jgi:hypothetical protein
MDHLGVARGALVWACLSLLVVVGLLAPASASAFTRAITDEVWALPGWQQWSSRAERAQARIVLLEVDWVSVEPTSPPPGADPTNPADSNFNFAFLDAEVRELRHAGIQPAFLVTDAPRWAEAPGGPANLEAYGAWEPSATAFGELAKVLAMRYSGSYPDPLHRGHALPRVRYYQAWAEGNFSIHLAPQWTRSGGTWVATAPTLYRNMLNAFYAGIKSAVPSDFVIATGFGPYGDPAPGACTGRGAPDVGSGCRIEPALFARDLMCLNGRVALKPVSCPEPPHFDALAIDPYEVGGPATSAGNVPGVQDDVSVPNLGRLTRIVKKAVATEHALPHARKQLWVTEFGYQTKPPNPSGVSFATQARWLQQALYLFWKQGVSTAVWYLISDVSEKYVRGVLQYSGLYFANGKPKPAAQAFRFPLVVIGSGRSATVWGISPRSGRLRVERGRGRSWKTVLRMRVSAGSVFVRTIPARLHGNFRAVIRGESSLVWRY